MFCVTNHVLTVSWPCMNHVLGQIWPIGRERVNDTSAVWVHSLKEQALFRCWQCASQTPQYRRSWNFRNSNTCRKKQFACILGFKMRVYWVHLFTLKLCTGRTIICFDCLPGDTIYSDCCKHNEYSCSSTPLSDNRGNNIY